MDEQDRPMTATLPRRRSGRGETLPPLPETFAYQTSMKKLADVIRPPWKRSDCRAELLARPYLHEVHKLESQTGEEKLAALLAALIMRFLAILFGVRVEIPPLTAQAARQRIEEKTQELAHARQEAVRAHFETDGVQAALKQRRLLRSCLVSQNLAVRQAMQAEQLELAMTLLGKQKQTTPERGANKREM